jgi:toxin YxiD
MKLVTRRSLRFADRNGLGLCGAFLLLIIFAGCQNSQRESPGGQTLDVVSQSGSGPSHDLSQDEAAGGHTLKKHVGRTDEQLQERLERERNISAASTYTDRETAERVVGAVLQQEQSRIQRWLERQGGHPNLVLDYDGDPAHPIGRTLRRGEDHAEPCSHALVVLKFKPQAEYYVLTTYPECR